MSESPAGYSVPPEHLRHALTLCEKAEADMVALERCLFVYRARLAGLVLRLRERQRHDPRRADGTYEPAIALQRRRDDDTIRLAHQHDAATVAALYAASHEVLP